MKVTEYQFHEDVSREVQAEVLQLIENARSLEEILDQWVTQRGNQLDLGVAIDDDERVCKKTIGMSLDLADGSEVCTAYLPRQELAQQYPNIKIFDSFLEKDQRKSSFKDMEMDIEVDDEKLNAWIRSLGFKDSDTLMASIGPWEGAIPLMLSFALSKGGGVIASQLDPQKDTFSDYAEELAEEGVDMRDYFQLFPQYSKEAHVPTSPTVMFDPIYCHKPTR